jgi:hypothetical protein
LHWLEQAQNPDGGWGERPRDGRSRAWCTAHTMLAFIYGRGTLSKGNEVEGVQWLREHSDSWMEPYNVEYEFDIPADRSRRGRANYRFDALPIVVLALLRSGLRPLAPDLLDGVNKLLEQQVDGVWIYPSSNQKTIFNLSHAMQAVTVFRKSLSSPEMVAELHNRISEMEGQSAEAAGPGRSQAGSSPRPAIWRRLSVAIALLSAVPVVWALVGADKLGQMLDHLSLLFDHPLPILISLSGIMLAARIGRWISTKVWLALWSLLLVFALLLSVHGGVWKTLAAVLPPLVAALVTYLLREFKKRGQPPDGV